MEYLIIWFRDLVIGFGNAFAWLITPFKDMVSSSLASKITDWLGIGSLTPLVLLTFSGLVVFLGVAIVKWLLS